VPWPTWWLDIEKGDFCRFTVDDEAEQERDAAGLSHALDQVIREVLDEREREILQRRYGFESDEPQTLETVGQFFGLTRERIRQIESKAFEKLLHGSGSAQLRGLYQSVEEEFEPAVGDEGTRGLTAVSKSLAPPKNNPPARAPAAESTSAAVRRGDELLRTRGIRPGEDFVIDVDEIRSVEPSDYRAGGPLAGSPFIPASLVLQTWEGFHGILSPEHRSSFLSRAEVRDLGNFPVDIFLRALEKCVRLADALEEARRLDAERRVNLAE
jgi:hypothetical protein